MHRLVVLHVEDNPDDCYLLAQAGKSAGLCGDFHAVASAGEAMAYLTGEGRFGDRRRFPFPDVIILDLIMPGMDGFEFLRWLRQNPLRQPVPVLVFTGSLKESDRAAALALGASGYFVKPTHFENLVRLVSSCLGSSSEPGIG